MIPPRDHGGGVDAAAAQYGGVWSEWIDLSTGINPVPYPVGEVSARGWATLPDHTAQEALIAAARGFWNVPEGAAVLAAPGASALIANMPRLSGGGRVRIDHPTYNEHRAAFQAAGWALSKEAGVRVVVHPNNPTGEYWEPDWEPQSGHDLLIIDESFCDIAPDQSLIALADRPGVVVLKSFGKFWGLAGLRLGFAIGDPALIDQLRAMLGPWPVAGPALEIGTRALSDTQWACDTRARLAQDAARLDRIMTRAGAGVVGGTDLFRLYDVDSATAWQARMAQAHIWTRIFPYSERWVRLGLPAPGGWERVEAIG
ncbi:MAG: threonine-phosphate decarboxylase [Rhodobacterales bacterium]|nr:MAG: threonine-phosphate decarboxylase [Rhodobacterales bacterium]